MKKSVHFVTVLLATAAIFISGLAAVQESSPERNAYFGETHLHTSWSIYAWIFGNRITGPADAYKYAKGETIRSKRGRRD